MDSPNSIEFTMKKKEDMKTSMQRSLIFVACFMPGIIILGIVMAVATQFLLAVMPVLIILSVYLCWYCMRFTKIEYEYVIQSGEFTVSAIYDNRSRKDLIKAAKIKDMSQVVPYHTNEPLLNAPGINQVLYYCSDLENPDLYISIFDHEKMGKIAVVFNTSRRLVQIMQFYNRLNVMLKNEFQI